MAILLWLLFDGRGITVIRFRLMFPGKAFLLKRMKQAVLHIVLDHFLPPWLFYFYYFFSLSLFLQFVLDLQLWPGICLIGEGKKINMGDRFFLFHGC